MNRPATSPPSVLVAVLGDLGRSPRMLNHARCFLARGCPVTLAGLRETELPADLVGHPALRVIGVTLPVEAAGSARAWARWRLLARLARERPVWDFVLVQNPPAFPVLAALALARRARRGALRPRIVIDWHNLGHALLAHAHRSRPAVAFYRRLEHAFARAANEHWAVSHALAEHLRLCLDGARIAVLHDQPPQWLRRAAHVSGDRDAWWRRVLPEVVPPPADSRWLAMPSSWTRDEAIELLTGAIELIAQGRVAWPAGARLAVIATGRGPRRTEFVASFPRQPDVTLHTPWLPAAAYAEMLAHADAGLCLHASASGLDLPLKLADMRGAGLPAIAYDYGLVLQEVFSPGHGATFKDAPDLAILLARLARQPPLRVPVIGPTWEEAWQQVAPGSPPV